MTQAPSETISANRSVASVAKSKDDMVPFHQLAKLPSRHHIRDAPSTNEAKSPANHGLRKRKNWATLVVGMETL